MTDFTKDELECLLHALKVDRRHNTDLYMKIKDMIDNHCEHHFYMIGASGNPLTQCHKCGKIDRLVRT